jgi:hypothetical protein
MKEVKKSKIETLIANLEQSLESYYNQNSIPDQYKPEITNYCISQIKPQGVDIIDYSINYYIPKLVVIKALISFLSDKPALVPSFIGLVFISINLKETYDDFFGLENRTDKMTPVKWNRNSEKQLKAFKEAYDQMKTQSPDFIFKFDDNKIEIKNSPISKLIWQVIMNDKRIIDQVLKTVTPSHNKTNVELWHIQVRDHYLMGVYHILKGIPEYKTQIAKVGILQEWLSQVIGLTPEINEDALKKLINKHLKLYPKGNNYIEFVAQ